LKGKRIAVIGTGSTGVQLTQDLAPLASEFTLFQRTPNLALPMKQMEFVGTNNQTMPRDKYANLYAERKQSYGGFDYNFMPVGTFEHDEKERMKTYQDLWEHGDFHFWLATYHDMLFEDGANTEAYNFWCVPTMRILV
jgi:cation diffusion facilitator CzcD-associated flavoprotein CzcO